MLDSVGIQPNPGRLIEALSHIGYKLEDSISDLVDNAISASANNILIRFLHDGTSIQEILVADDGTGMRPPVLKESMRFGSAENTAENSLGKYGLGMKLASLAYCNNLRVCSRVGNTRAGLSWSIEGISAGWRCGKIKNADCREVLDSSYGPVTLDYSGTIVQWCELKNLPTHKKGIRSLLGGIARRLQLHLGTRFHRFIQDSRVAIHLDQQITSATPQDYWLTIKPLDPFGYVGSGHPDYPSKFRSGPIARAGCVNFEAHVWPPKSESENYRLGKRTSANQGFFVYRNDRLIQAGGWLGLVNDETEAHSSLARIKMDLPSSLEDLFSLNVQKSNIIPPIEFADAIRNSKNKEGLSWDQFRSAAVSTYRMANHSDIPAVLFLNGEKPFKNHEKAKRVGVKWSKAEDAPAIFFDGQNLVFNKKLDFRKNISAPDYLHRLLAEVALSFLNNQKNPKGSPFGKELNDSLVRVLKQEIH